MRAQKESRRAPPCGCGALRLLPVSRLYFARPLAVGRGEKLSTERGAGLTAKGRAKYNRETGSNLKAPQPQGGKRRDSFCARMGPVAEKSEKGSRARASMKRWNCPGW